MQKRTKFLLSFKICYIFCDFFHIYIFVYLERKFYTCQILFLRIHFWNLILFEYLSKPLPFWEGSHANPSIVWWQYARPKSWLMIIWLISDPSKHPLLVVKMSFFENMCSSTSFWGRPAPKSWLKYTTTMGNTADTKSTPC